MNVPLLRQVNHDVSSFAPGHFDKMGHLVHFINLLIMIKFPFNVCRIPYLKWLKRRTNKKKNGHSNGIALNWM